MKVVAQISVVAGLALAGSGVTYLVTGAPDRGVACDPAGLKADEICLDQVPDQVVWVDARLRGEWEQSRAPGAVLWNLDPAEDMQAFEAAAMGAMFEARLVVVYCTDEGCGTSRQVAERIRGLGLGTEVKVLFGGWRALSAAGITDSSPVP
ncbi:MAG: rhodanese-like domain-containing protein [Verrucomicrobiota bacterium JB025]|nr:rhodanese-like domain-containing protein [Verrucomicrobiota bacterium JB025]